MGVANQRSTLEGVKVNNGCEQKVDARRGRVNCYIITIF